MFLALGTLSPLSLSHAQEGHASSCTCKKEKEERELLQWIGYALPLFKDLFSFSFYILIYILKFKFDLNIKIKPLGSYCGMGYLRRGFMCKGFM